MDQLICIGCNAKFDCPGSYKRKYCTTSCMSEHFQTRMCGDANPNYRHGPKHCESCGSQISKNAQRWCKSCQAENFTAYLTKCGHEVLILWETDILNSPDTVKETILAANERVIFAAQQTVALAS